MAARLFQRFGSSSNMVKLFEIRPDNDIIILRGSGEEAASQWLTGVVVLSLSAPMEVKDVRLEFTGNKKISWHDSNAHLLHPRAERESVIYKHDWEPFVKGGTLPADNYEWPFRVQLPGTTAESVEGIPEKYILYKLKAAVNRGRMSHDVHVWKPIRIVRTLGPDALELSHAMTVENIWTNKIEYEIVIPQKGVVFGTSITIKMQFTPLLKGLRIGTITAQLVEFQEFAVDKVYKATREVATWTFELTDENYHDMLSENGQDGYRLEGDCPLPKDLRKCLQDVDIQGIKIRHKVKFKVSLHNPDGHVSELRATLPVTIFISPNMPLNPDGCLVDQAPRSAQAVENVQHAPPLYGEHVLDQLYADVDTSGIMTPLPQSGMNTPFYAGSQSRSGSQENLHGFALSNGAQLGHSLPANGAVTPAALSSRLQSLNVGSRNNTFNAMHAGSGSSTPHHEGDTGHFGQNGHSSRNSSRNSEEDHHHHEGARMTPAELDDLSRVPSYRTAVMTPVRGMSQSDVVPTYATATSRPATPVRANSSVSASRGESSRTNGTANVSQAMSNIGFTPIQSPNPAASPQSDAERNLFLLRQRE